MKVIALLVGLAIVAVLVPLIAWLSTRYGARKARRLQAEYPRAWVRSMSRGRGRYVVVIDADQIRLLGAFDRIAQQYSRAELVDATVGVDRFPLASRRCLALRFANGMTWKLLTTRRGGFASAVPDAESAIAYLKAHPASAQR